MICHGNTQSMLKGHEHPARTLASVCPDLRHSEPRLPSTSPEQGLGQGQLPPSSSSSEVTAVPLGVTFASWDVVKLRQLVSENLI